MEENPLEGLAKPQLLEGNPLLGNMGFVKPLLVARVSTDVVVENSSSVVRGGDQELLGTENFD